MHTRKRWLGGIFALGIILASCTLLTVWMLQQVGGQFNQLRPPSTPCPKSVCTPDPNNPRIAFASDRFNIGHEIHLMNADGTCVTQLTNFWDFPWDKREAVRPRWSPDGSQLLFELSWASDKELYVVSIDNEQVRRLTWQGRNFDGRWSPEGNKIAFKSDRDGQPELYVMEADGANQKQLGDIPVLGKPEILLFPKKDYDWSPDGKRIAFTGLDPIEKQQEVYISDVDSGESVNLTNHPAVDDFITWWPQENRILFKSDRTTSKDNFAAHWWTLYVMEADGTNIQRIVDLAPTSIPSDPFVDGWSSENTFDVVLRGLYNVQKEYQLGVYILNVACALKNPPESGTLPEECYNKINLPVDFSYSNPYLSSEKTKFVFKATDTSRLSDEIVVISDDGTNITNLTNCSASDIDPAWSP